MTTVRHRPGAAVGIVRAVVVGSEGVDLIAEAAVSATGPVRAYDRPARDGHRFDRGILARGERLNIANVVTVIDCSSRSSSSACSRGGTGWRLAALGASSWSPRSPTCSTASWPAAAG